jgi:transposase-like protein
MSKSSPKLVPDPEVPTKPTRRRFTAAYKAKIVAECDAATEPGAVGAILRREGLYSSHLSSWRRQLKLEGIDGVSAKKRGPKPKPEMQRENERLQRRLAQAEERLRRAELIIEAQKKLSEVLGLSISPTPSDESTS